MKDIRRTAVSLVLRLEDFASGQTLIMTESSLEADGGFTRPVFKRDGYIVFTGGFPEIVVIRAEGYEHACFHPSPERPGVLRIALVPIPGRGANLHSLSLDPGKTAHMGFWRPGAGYALAGNAPADSRELALQKDDMEDITSMWHLITSRNGDTAEAVYIAEGMGCGRYRLSSPLPMPLLPRESRILPMKRVVGPPGGQLALPIPQNAQKLFSADESGGLLMEAVL